ncbi:CAAX prenyl protease 1 homolog [Camellia sinensis]|uniref:CAAX prenyl protease 1 homolog n=1 Tax=Camellia sinensis TaxID=4442 RepID=UPI001036B4D0|nr:CAAX prenyl protease 1 homolog [Camellia sinensis]
MAINPDTWEELDPDELSYDHTVIPLQHHVSFGLNLVSRSFEFQADAFAQKLGYASLLRARLPLATVWRSGGIVYVRPYLEELATFLEENLSAMNTDPLYSAYHYSHPPFVERLAAIDELDKKED